MESTDHEIPEHPGAAATTAPPSPAPCPEITSRQWVLMWLAVVPGMLFSLLPLFAALSEMPRLLLELLLAPVIAAGILLVGGAVAASANRWHRSKNRRLGQESQFTLAGGLVVGIYPDFATYPRTAIRRAAACHALCMATTAVMVAPLILTIWVKLSTHPVEAWFEAGIYFWALFTGFACVLSLAALVLSLWVAKRTDKNSEPEADHGARNATIAMACCSLFSSSILCAVAVDWVRHPAYL
jgi:hypothetical protein